MTRPCWSWDISRRILICGLNFSPELVGTGKYTGEMAQWLADKGYSVRVVTTHPYYPEWKKRTGSRRYWYSKDRTKGVEIIRCPIYVPSRPSGLRRIVHLLSFSFTGFPAMMAQVAWKPDIVLMVAPTLMSAPSVLALSAITRSRKWLHIQDYESDAAFSLGILSKLKVLRPISDRLENWMLSRFDRVSSISDRMLAHGEEAKGIAPEVMVKLPNWADIQGFGVTEESPSTVKQNLGISGRHTLVLYAGNIGEKQGLDQVIKVADNLRGRPDIHFVFCGDGLGRRRLTRLAGDLGLEDIHWIHPLPSNQFASLMKAADIHLVTQLSQVADLVLPSKVTNILAAGGAMVVTAAEDTQLGEIADSSDFALRCEPESLDELQNAIVDLADSPERRQVMGLAAIEYARSHLNRDQILSVLSSELEILAERK